MSKLFGVIMGDKKRVVVFMEDSAQEALIPPLFMRLATEEGVSSNQIDIRVLNARGGVPLHAFKQFVKDARKQRSLYADLLIVGSDANCKGFAERRNMVLKVITKSPYPEVVTAIPDPHVERWYMLDPAAISRAVGARMAVATPAYKCAKNHYKNLLHRVFLENDIAPPLGGIEYGPLIAQHMDLYTAAKQDHGLADFIDRVRAWLRRANISQ